MRVLWFSLVLVGTITCAPLQAGNPDVPVWYYSSTVVSQDPSEEPAQSSPESSEVSYYSSYKPAGGAVISSSGPQQSSQAKYPGSYQQTAQGGWSSSPDVADQEPVFTPVSAEDQVYARKSRSQYRKSNLRFHQFVYVPTEPLGPYEPVYPHHGKGQKGF